MPGIFRRQPKKEKAKVEEVVAKTEDASCQTRGCGCGNWEFNSVSSSK